LINTLIVLALSWYPLLGTGLRETSENRTVAPFSIMVGGIFAALGAIF